MPVYDEAYIRAKVRGFNDVIKINFLDSEVPKENMHYTCIAYILLCWMENKNHLQVYLKECKYRIKKIQMSRFINTELKSESEPGSESESDTDLMAKLESASDSE